MTPTHFPSPFLFLDSLVSPSQRERGAGGNRLGRPEIYAAAGAAGSPDAEAGGPEQEKGAPGDCPGALPALPQALQELRAGVFPAVPRHLQHLQRAGSREPLGPAGPRPAQPGGHGHEQDSQN